MSNQAQDDVRSPLVKKEANEPATAVTTKIPQASRTTSTICPAGVTGFVKEEETVTICAVEKKSASPNPWMLLPLSPSSYDHNERRAGGVHEQREAERDEQAREESPVPLAPGDQAP